ncbi:hypothetical protein HQ489_00365 [Candidatus Woesearchaeota archaeon]|nr:hypothetical protein [Candidatus Woesearchaeota archaeon]
MRRKDRPVINHSVDAVREILEVDDRGQEISQGKVWVTGDEFPRLQGQITSDDTFDGKSLTDTAFVPGKEGYHDTDVVNSETMILEELEHTKIKDRLGKHIQKKKDEGPYRDYNDFFERESKNLDEFNLTLYQLNVKLKQRDELCSKDSLEGMIERSKNVLNQQSIMFEKTTNLCVYFYFKKEKEGYSINVSRDYHKDSEGIFLINIENCEDKLRRRTIGYVVIYERKMPLQNISRLFTAYNQEKGIHIKKLILNEDGSTTEYFGGFTPRILESGTSTNIDSINLPFLEIERLVNDYKSKNPLDSKFEEIYKTLRKDIVFP